MTEAEDDVVSGERYLSLLPALRASAVERDDCCLWKYSAYSWIQFKYDVPPGSC